MRRLFHTMLCAFALLCCIPADAHKPSDSYLALDVQGQRISGQWDIALRDLDMAIGLDRDGNGELTWGEVRAQHDAIAAYALSRLTISNGAAVCSLRVTQHLIDEHSDGTYAVMMLQGSCAEAMAAPQIVYRLLFDIDPQHKGLLRLEQNGSTRTAIFSPERASQVFDQVKTSRLIESGAFVRSGIWHIWTGFDHILFLLSMLLPAVLVYRCGAWHGSEAFKPVAFEVLKVVSAFTLAHSITLSLATLALIALPSRLVESGIAASVLLAALNNVRPLVLRRRALVAFGFGLLHGFGFASVLIDLGLPKAALLWSLVGFNVGVEVGQIAIVAAFLPLAWCARNSATYRSLIMRGGSLLIAFLAALWLAERMLGLRLIS